MLLLFKSAALNGLFLCPLAYVGRSSKLDTGRNTIDPSHSIHAFI